MLCCTGSFESPARSHHCAIHSRVYLIQILLITPQIDVFSLWRAQGDCGGELWQILCSLTDYQRMPTCQIFKDNTRKITHFRTIQYKFDKKKSKNRDFLERTGLHVVIATSEPHHEVAQRIQMQKKWKKNYFNFRIITCVSNMSLEHRFLRHRSRYGCAIWQRTVTPTRTS